MPNGPMPPLKRRAGDELPSNVYALAWLIISHARTLAIVSLLGTSVCLAHALGYITFHEHPAVEQSAEASEGTNGQ